MSKLPVTVLRKPKCINLSLDAKKEKENISRTPELGPERYIVSKSKAVLEVEYAAGIGK